MNAAVIVAIVIVGLIILGLRYGPARSGKKKSPGDELLQLCRGDKAMVERLIGREMQRKPSLSRKAAARAAAYSIKRDNR